MTTEQMIIEAHLDSLSWFPGTARDLPHLVLALCGETGEVANMIKKFERGSQEFDAAAKLELAEEIADVFTYLCCIAGVLNIDLEKVYQLKRSKNIERWGEPDHAAAIATINAQSNGQGN